MSSTIAIRKEFQASLYRNSIMLLIALPDFIAIIISTLIAYAARFPNVVAGKEEVPTINLINYKLILFLIAIGWFLFFIGSGVYRFSHSNLIAFNLSLVIKKSVAYFFFVGFISFIFKASFSRGVFLLMLSSGIGILFIFRISIFLFILRPLILSKKISANLMIIGKNKNELKEYTDWLISNRKLGFSAVSRFECAKITIEWLEEFDRVLRHKKITEVLMLPGMEADKNFSKFIHYCEDLDIHVNWIPMDSGNMGYWLIPSPQESIPFLTFKESKISLIMKITKRLFDLAFASTVLIIFSPIYIIVALLVVINSGFPILYTSRRVGLDGKSFNFYKFRTMVKDADEMVTEVKNMHGKGHVLFKNPEDPRITSIGKFLRKYSLDELPQFWNVIKNDMSVVGPRPALAREVEVYNSIYERRLNVKPGITGPWQISGRSNLDLQTSTALDLNYLSNWSFTRDIWIIIATIGAVIKGKGAY